MKKLFAVMLISSLCFTFSACSSDKAQNNLSKAIDDAGRDVEEGFDKAKENIDGIDKGHYNNETDNNNGVGTSYYGNGYMGYKYDNMN